MLRARNVIILQLIIDVPPSSLKGKISSVITDHIDIHISLCQAQDNTKFSCEYCLFEILSSMVFMSNHVPYQQAHDSLEVTILFFKKKTIS